VRWYDLARGTAVALYAIRPERRAVLDSHIGMMLFKNGVPGRVRGRLARSSAIAGSASTSSRRSGAASPALLFGQVLRVYRQCFGVGRFIAEPSQFGGTNREGLRSGAFWFYYRLGFRPVDADAARRASEEWSRMGADPRYRTPEARFAVHGLRHRASARRDDEVETSELSHLVTAWIAPRFAAIATRPSKPQPTASRVCSQPPTEAHGSRTRRMRSKRSRRSSLKYPTFANGPARSGEASFG
jgi:hypothetical protein